MTPLESIAKKVLSKVRGPVKARVMKSYIKKDKGGYCFDGEVLMPESLEGTGEILKEVPLNPIWAGSAGQGIYCPPGKDQIVVVSFLHFNEAFPYSTGIWSDGYTPADGAEGHFVLVDGKGGIFRMSGDGLFSLLNNGKSLKGLLEEIVDGFINLSTTGSPEEHTLNPALSPVMAKLKADISLLFKE